MTNLDALYSAPLQRAVEGGTVRDWPLVKQIRRINIDIADAIVTSQVVNRAMPIEGQEQFRELQAVVDECAQVLQIKVPPRVFVSQNSDLNAYVTGFEPPYSMVLTSGLLDQLDGRPDELRFIIGHELGHLKCEHVRCHNVGRILVGLLSGGEDGSFRKEVATPVLVWKLLWRGS